MADRSNHDSASGATSAFVEFFASVTGVSLTADAVAAYIKDDPNRWAWLAAWNEDAHEVTDRVASDFAEYICGRPWPLHGDNSDLDAYLAVLRAAAITKGYHVTSWHTYSR
jgi:hypothetical protein